jgi:hypothetical protein
VKEWEKIPQVSRAKKQTGTPVLLSDKAVFKPQLVRDNGHFKLIKGMMLQKDRTIKIHNH